jgi:hypothetical protein
MFKKLNKKIILLSCLITAVVLFGGWFLLSFFNTEKPIQDWAAEEQGMEIVNIRTAQDRLEVSIRFENHPDFGIVYASFDQFLQQTLMDRNPSIQLDAEQGELHPFWLEHSAPFLELIQAGSFNELNDEMNRLLETDEVNEGEVYMNSEHVFLYFAVEDGDEIYIVMPMSWQGGERS